MPRQRTLEASVDWSYNLLRETEQGWVRPDLDERHDTEVEQGGQRRGKLNRGLELAHPVLPISEIIGE